MCLQRRIYLLVVLLFLSLPLSMCSAEMTPADKQDLMQLKQELAIVLQNNEQLAINSTALEQDLTLALEQLSLSKTQITLLKQQLTQHKIQLKEATTLSRTAESDLSAANKLLDEWKKERDKELAQAKQEAKMYKLMTIVSILFGLRR